MTDKTHPASVDVDALAEKAKSIHRRRSGIQCGLLTAAACDKLDGELHAVIDQLAAAARQAPAPQPATPRDRDADRERFPDPQFNRWLDEAITENGEYSVWHQIGDTCAAWHGWENRDFYRAPQPLQAAGVEAAVAARFHRLYSIVRRIRWNDYGFAHVNVGSDSAAAMRELCEFLFADGLDAAISKRAPEQAAGVVCPNRFICAGRCSGDRCAEVIANVVRAPEQAAQPVAESIVLDIAGEMDSYDFRDVVACVRAALAAKGAQE